MLLSLITLALMMGITGGPHCLMMCGPACSLLAQKRLLNTQGASEMFFLLGRSLGYGLIGALVAVSMQTLGWLSTQSTLFRPVWNMTHVLAMFLGLFLALFADQPLWLGDMAKGLWRKLERLMARHALFQHAHGVLLVGVLWSFIPCSLLYSVLMVAALSASAIHGALVMLSFSLGGAVFMALGSRLFIRLSSPGESQAPLHEPLASSPLSFVSAEALKSQPERLKVIKRPALAQWGIRLTGLALAANSAWIIYNDLVLNQAPWCLPSP